MVEDRPKVGACNWFAERLFDNDQKEFVSIVIQMFLDSVALSKLQRTQLVSSSNSLMKSGNLGWIVVAKHIVPNSSTMPDEQISMLANMYRRIFMTKAVDILSRSLPTGRIYSDETEYLPI